MGDQGARVMDLTSLNSQFLEQSVPLLEASSIWYYFIYSPVFSKVLRAGGLDFLLDFSSHGIFLVCLTQRPLVSHSSTQVCWLVSWGCQRLEAYGHNLSFPQVTPGAGSGK